MIVSLEDEKRTTPDKTPSETFFMTKNKREMDFMFVDMLFNNNRCKAYLIGTL